MSGIASASRRAGAVALVLGVMVVGAGCGSDGDDLDEFDTGSPPLTEGDRDLDGAPAAVVQVP